MSNSGHEELFDLSAEYDAMLNQGISLSGESKEFFVEGRLASLKRWLPQGLVVRKILDYGCGTGLTSKRLSEVFLEATVVGVDTSANALQFATENYGSDRIGFHHLDELASGGDFDLCYVNGVFHHIPLDQRDTAASGIHKALRSGGVLALFENNPWNPGARMVMSRIPFDRDAIMLSPRETSRLVEKAGLRLVSSPRSLFYFPRKLAFLRPAERRLESLPFGAQYAVLAAKS